MKWPTLPGLLSFNAGYLDTAGYLALHGLFTAHVTGNFVTLGAALVQGTGGAMAKLLALPVFCIVVMSARLLRYALIGRGLPVLRTMFLLKMLLLMAGAAMAWRFGPFSTGDSLPAIVTGMVFVTAMALQNAAQRVHLPHAPPSTLMTGTTTQIMLDLGDMLHGLPADERPLIQERLARMATNLGAFACGCAVGAVLYHVLGTICFVVPPLVALVIYRHKDARFDT